jgi:predicted aspartyl protease
MLSRRFFLTLLLAGLVIAGPSQASGADRPDLVPALRDTTGSLPFDLHQGYGIVVRGSAGSLNDLNFFLDTGTIHSTFDSRIASELSLRDQAPAGLATLGGRVQAESAILPSLSIGSVHLSSLHIFTADLSPFEKVLFVRIDAIIGMDVLGLSPFVIDYTARAIRFGASPALPNSIPLRLDQGLAVFDAEIDNRPVHLLLDTGASSFVLFKTDSQSDSGADHPAGRTPVSSGEIERKQVLLRDLKVGHAEFRQEPTRTALNPKPSRIDADGLMSPAALGISQLSVNLAKGVWSFSR